MVSGEIFLPLPIHLKVKIGVVKEYRGQEAKITGTNFSVQQGPNMSQNEED